MSKQTATIELTELELAMMLMAISIGAWAKKPEYKRAYETTRAKLVEAQYVFYPEERPKEGSPTEGF